MRQAQAEPTGVTQASASKHLKATDFIENYRN